MTGKPGRSGGRRTGAGRPTQQFTIKIGDRFLLQERTPTGGSPAVLLTAISMDRTEVRFDGADGTTYIISR